MSSSVNPKQKNDLELLRREIRVELARRGWSQGRLAQEVGRKRNTVNRAINHGENAETLNLVLYRLGLHS